MVETSRTVWITSFITSQHNIILLLLTEIQYLPISQMFIMMWFWFQFNSGACDRYDTLSSVRLTQQKDLVPKKTTTRYRFKSPSLPTDHHGWISVCPFFSASHWWNWAADTVVVTATSQQISPKSEIISTQLIYSREGSNAAFTCSSDGPHPRVRRTFFQPRCVHVFMLNNTSTAVSSI